MISPIRRGPAPRRPSGDADGARHAPATAHPLTVNRRRRRARRRRVYRRIAIVVAIPLAVVAYSYVRALTGPGTDSVSARSVEWMREHHLGGAVDAFERRWYQHHQAKIGGAPDASIAQPQLATSLPATTSSPTHGPVTADPSTTTASSTTTTRNATPTASTTTAAAAQPSPANVTALPAPAALQTPAAAPIAGEGAWSSIGPVVAGTNGSTGAYGTLIRPDAVHTSVLDAVVWIDPHVLAMRQYPGAKVPGAPWDRPDHVEADRQSRLIAAFAGGFRLADSHGGMILGGTVLAPMRVGAATLTIDANGVPNIGAWGRDIDPSATFDSARQNLDLIVDAGAPVPRLLQDPNRAWGFTGPANKSAVWRSGAGITADGALVWVGGPGLTIEALAETLVRGGAVRGMQLDINHEWVQLDTYTTAASGVTSGTRILPDMQHTGNRWLTEDTRDFVAVFERTSTTT
jgi:hypothetical protein